MTHAVANSTAPVGTLAPVKPVEKERQLQRKGASLVGSVTGKHTQGQTQGAYGEKKETHQPTHDQLYLASQINATASSSRLTPAAIQKLNCRYGLVPVSDALRSLRGFPPAELRSAYGYVEKLAREATS